MTEQSIHYRLVRSNRKTIAIQITPAGEVVVRCPRRMGAGDVRAFVESRASWIQKHLPRTPARPPFSEAELKALAERAKDLIPARAAYFAPLVGVSYGRITIRAQKSRWGSCSAGGNLNFNCLLMLAPPEVLDYVVVHELCHRKHMDHSAAFWREVERVLPDHRDRRKWLKEQGGDLIRRLSGACNPDESAL